MLGWGDVSEFGTSFAALGPLRPFFGVNAFEPDFLGVARMGDDKPSDDGQFGVAMRIMLRP